MYLFVYRYVDTTPVFLTRCYLVCTLRFVESISFILMYALYVRCVHDVRDVHDVHDVRDVHAVHDIHDVRYVHVELHRLK